MNETIDLIVAVSGAVMALIGLIQVHYMVYLDRRNRAFFCSFFGIALGYALCVLTRVIARGQTEYVWVEVSRAVLFGQAFLSSLLTVLLIGFILYQCGEHGFSRDPVFRLAAVLWAVYVILLVVTQFTGSVYSVDDQNVYRRGPYFAAQMILPVVNMLLYLYALWKNRRKISQKQLRAFLLYAVIPLPCIIIQMFFFGAHLILLGTVLATLLMYNSIVFDHMNRYIMQEKENAGLKIDIMLAQIQPHFLFNSLSIIRYFCRTDPDKAAEAVDDFTAYLRHNMDSLTIDKPIPFEEELAHVRAYLALQKMRFGDDLMVEFDLQFTDFFIPTLTFQPLVENAISYGLRKSESGSGIIRISTAKYKNHIELNVADDGPGFDPDAMVDDKTRSHIGIRNVRERLNRICGGELIIKSAPGEGTSASIRLPLIPEITEKEQD